MTTLRIFSSTLLIGASLLAHVEAAPEQVQCALSGARPASSQPLATVQRIDAEKVRITWSVPGPMDVLIATDPMRARAGRGSSLTP